MAKVPVPILSGIAASETGEFRARYPVNLEPVVIDNKISKGQLRVAPGASQLGTGPGADRGRIVWNSQHYRVMGTSLVRIDAAEVITTIGDVGGSGPVWMDYSFDRLAIGSGANVYYYNGVTLFQVTDPDLGQIVDGLWIDGYFMMTDGTYVIVTELSDPTSILSLKYGSAEEDPDMVTGLLKYRDEAYIFGRNTIQVYRNVGGNGFPFLDQKGAGIPFGCVGPRAKALFGDGFAFVGGARGEALDVYFGSIGQAVPAGSREVCDALAAVADPSSIEVEVRTSLSEQRLLIHLPTETWVFLYRASKAAEGPVWYRLQSGHEQPYRLRHSVEAHGKAWVGDVVGGALGYLDHGVASHFGETAESSFEAGLIYNDGDPATVHAIELIGLTGRGSEGSVFLSMTLDGETWSEERALSTGKIGERGKRLQWRPHVRFRNSIGLKFRIYGNALPGIAACLATVTP